MKKRNKKVSSPETIRAAIREEFAFLAESGYAEVPVSPPSDECYAEVHFQKGHWRIAVLTTAHGTRATMDIISPEGQRGFLSHLGESQCGSNIFSDIKCKAKFLQEHGSALLQVSTDDFDEILKAVTRKQLEWIQKSGIGQQ